MKALKPFIVIACMLMFGFTKAQTSNDWKPLWLSSTNMFKGVEGFYQVTTCDGNEIVLLKFVNHNAYGIKAGWKNMVVTKDNQRHLGNASADSLTVAANSTVLGDCKSDNALLLVKIKSFGIDAATFNVFVASEFDFKVTH